MTDLHFTTATLGIGLALTIFYLVRKDHLYLRDGLFWSLVALCVLLFGLLPGLIDYLGQIAGIAYSPALILTLGLIVLLVKALYADMHATSIRRDLRRLNQKMAMLEFELSEARRVEDEDPPEYALQPDRSGKISG